MRTWLAVLAVILLGGALVRVGALNTFAIPSIDLYVLEFRDVPVWLALTAGVLLGAGLAAAVFVLPILRLKLQVRRGGRRISQLEQELHGLRTLPLDDSPPGKTGGP